MQADQRSVLKRALRVAQDKGASPREMKALVTALAVESNYRDLSYGDRDSVGALQQRPSQGWGPASESLETDVAQFLRAAKKANTGRGSAGQLAQAVQRSAFPGRYDERGAEADALIRRYSRSGTKRGSRGGSGSDRPVRDSYRTETTPGVDRSADRLALKQQYLSVRGKPGALASLKLGLDQAQDTPPESRRVRVEGEPSSNGSDGARGGSTRSYGEAGRRYAGTEGKIIPLSQRAHALGLKTTSGKRDTMNTASGGVSDHYKGKKNATARDWSGPPEKMDQLARSIAAGLGVRDFKGGVLNVKRGGFRYQLLWKTNVGGDHFTHIHLGVEKL